MRNGRHSSDVCFTLLCSPFHRIPLLLLVQRAFNVLIVSSGSTLFPEAPHFF
jgi:hypothetical protein